MGVNLTTLCCSVGVVRGEFALFQMRHQPKQQELDKDNRRTVVVLSLI